MRTFRAPRPASEDYDDYISVHVSGETLARLRRISSIDGRSPEDLALCAVDEEALKDMRGDALRSA